MIYTIVSVIIIFLIIQGVEMETKLPRFVKQHEKTMNITKLKKARNYFIEKLILYFGKKYNSWGILFNRSESKIKFAFDDQMLKDNLGFNKTRINKIKERFSNLEVSISYLVTKSGRFSKKFDMLECYIIPEMYNDNFNKEKINDNVSRIYAYSFQIKNEDTSVIINNKMKNFILLLDDIIKTILFNQVNSKYLKEMRVLMENKE